jgi:DNA-binding NtrC family response regulator
MISLPFNPSRCGVCRSLHRRPSPAVNLCTWSACMAPATVLLIDSDADSIAIYSLILRHHGFSVIEARDPEIGLQMAYEENPDVVVSELFLPPVRGISLLDRLRSDDRLAAKPLIVLDSVPAYSTAMEETLGPVNRLKKPCAPSRLLHEVQRVLDQPLPTAR